VPTADRSTRTLHALALLLFGVVTALWMWPVLKAPAAAIPGSGAGDNFIFVWNLWWAKHSLLAGTSPLWCTVLFVPLGVDLTLHANTLPATAIAGLLVRDVIAGTNAIVCAHLFLNFVAGYLLAWRVTRDWPAALFGAIVLGWSPFVGGHLPGHFSFVAVWILPLTALLTLDVFEGSRPRALLLGILLAATPYFEYYYAVYAAALVGMLVILHVCSTARRELRSAAPRRVLLVIGILIALALLVAAIVLATGGTVWHAGGVTISLRSPGNAIAAAWLLSLAAAGIAIGTRVRLHVDRHALVTHLRQLAPAIAVGLVLTLPLVVAGARLMISGDYVSQRYFWRSAPRGIDLATLVVGNPHGLLWGDRPLRAYARFGIDAMEQTAWMAPATLCLSAVALFLRRRDPMVRLWAWSARVLIWALGPYVAAFGHTLPLPLPAALIRYVPIVANARIPARAIVLVYVSIAMLAAIGFVALRQRRQTTWAMLLATAAVIDLAPARPPLFAVERPALYETLRSRPEEGAVCELPMGLRDGFGETGRLDMRVMFYQAIHERPITGGFVGRLSPRVIHAYEDDPVLGILLRLSGGRPLAGEHPLSPSEAGASLLRAGIRFVVVNEDGAPADLLRYASSGLPLREVARDGNRDLYEISSSPTARAARPAR
jgi:hypothetical protein